MNNTNDMKYFLLHDFMYGWDVVESTEDNQGRSHVVLMDTLEEAEHELLDVKDEADLWQIGQGHLCLERNKVISTTGEEYDYFL